MKIRTFVMALAASMMAASACGSKEPAIITPPIHNEGEGGGGEKEDENLPKLGDVIPAWQEGWFDIHFINTQMGECTFLIFPDGTQMLIDSAGSMTATGDVGSTTNVGIRSRWDPTKDKNFNCNKFIAAYLDKCMEWTGNKTLDYVLLTHFHNDHYGAHLGLPVSPNSPTYRQQSMVYIMDNYKIGKLLDRGYPEYDYPFDMMKYYNAGSESSVYNWITAVRWHVANKGLNVEKIKAGSKSQVVPAYNASKYGNFSVRNIGVNGEVWTGVGESTTMTFPSKDAIVCAGPPNVTNADNCPEENHDSAVLKFSYGKFDYWAGGDMQYDGMSSHSWKDIETPMAMACGIVDVMKADHHGCSNTNGFGYKDKCWAMKYLQPKCWIVNSWTDGHPREATFNGMTNLEFPPDIYITNTCDSQKKYAKYSSIVKGADGHVVVRVMNGGGSYYVYVLNDSDGSMTIKSINSYGSR